MEKFNENLIQLLDNIVSVFPDAEEGIRKHYVSIGDGDVYLLEFFNNCRTLGNDISNKDEIVFSEEHTILEGIDFNKIWNSDILTSEHRENIWKYLHTLYIFAYEYVKKVDLKKVLKGLKNISSDETNLDLDTQNLINIVNNLTKKIDDSGVEPVSDDTTGSSFPFVAPELFNGTIGSLAKEIAESIDPSKINLDDPAALLRDLVSGNFNEDDDSTGLTNLVKNITVKIQDKLSSGELDQAALFADAQNMMKSLGSMGGAGAGGAGGPGGAMDEVFKNLMTSMNMNKSQVKKNMAHLSETEKRTRIKERLKQKIAAAQLLLDKEEEMLEEELNKLKASDALEPKASADFRDIDALVREIEGDEYVQ
tara:strand:+ start:8982 stop:10079 length:1098 start_codon:yes stop_codon:yes gene_type:complete